MSFDPVWEKVFSTRAWGKYPELAVVRFIARNFYSTPERKDIKILEIGCGTGANLWFYGKEGFSVYGIDGSKTAIEIANSRLNQECPNWVGKLSIGDFAKLDFSDNFFDVVVDSAAVCTNNFENATIAYEEAHRVLKPNGKLLVITFADGSWGDGTGKKLADGEYECSEGPVVGLGLARFTRKEKIPQLLHKFKIDSIEMNTQSYENMTKQVKEWIITAHK